MKEELKILKANEYIQSIGEETLREFYATHSLSVTAKHFKMGENTLKNIIKILNLEEHSPSDLKEFKKIHLEETLIDKYGVTNVSHLDEVKNKIKESLSKVDKDAVMEKVKATKKIKYGDENYNNINKIKSTMIERYGADSYSKSDGYKKIANDILKKRREKRYESLPLSQIKEEYITSSSHELALKYHMHTDSFLKFLDWAGIKRHSREEDMKFMTEKVNSQVIEKYGKLPWELGLESQIKNGINRGLASEPEQKFIELLNKNNIKFETEFKINNRYYDFKIGNTLIELNPTATHNVNWNPFGGEIKSKDYHYLKTLLARENGYRCINIWDWDNLDSIINLLTDRISIGARKCELKTVSIEEEKSFLIKNHVQGYVKSTVAYGLYYNNELVSLMSFGEPRYNKKYDFELLRYVSIYNIYGGANKLFNKFKTEYSGKSVVSYCDRSKFSGEVYKDLGFELKHESKYTRHWYNIKSDRHITDNLLRQRGFDQLFGTDFGKEYSNEELMILNKFLEVYDCGQQTYTYINKGGII